MKYSNCSKELMRTFDADYVNDNNHRKRAKRSNNRVSMTTGVLGRVRNDSNPCVSQWTVQSRVSVSGRYNVVWDSLKRDRRNSRGAWATETRYAATSAAGGDVLHGNGRNVRGPSMHRDVSTAQVHMCEGERSLCRRDRAVRAERVHS
ncbi:hypothetical protein LSAT2_031511 [Lamellibrachia satsuma]|nr:hypothetical protein LSAT2_031511 [Lamellibrachia satsuma]